MIFKIQLCPDTENTCFINKENRYCYNTIWVYNDNLKQSIYIKKEQLEEYISNGWKIGRKIKEYK